MLIPQLCRTWESWKTQNLHPDSGADHDQSQINGAKSGGFDATEIQSDRTELKLGKVPS